MAGGSYLRAVGPDVYERYWWNLLLLLLGGLMALPLLAGALFEVNLLEQLFWLVAVVGILGGLLLSVAMISAGLLQVGLWKRLEFLPVEEAQEVLLAHGRFGVPAKVYLFEHAMVLDHGLEKMPTLKIPYDRLRAPRLKGQKMFMPVRRFWTLRFSPTVPEVALEAIGQRVAVERGPAAAVRSDA